MKNSDTQQKSKLKIIELNQNIKDYIKKVSASKSFY